MTDEMVDADKLKSLEAEVAKLPRSVEPPPDAWIGICSAIDRESVTPIGRASDARDAVKYWQRPRFLAAAAAALIAASTTTTVALMRERSVTLIHASAMATSQVVQFSSRETRYIASANQLQTLLESSESRLSSETIAKLKKSAAIIDAAIAEARAALAADPANRELMDMVSSRYDSKLDLLRRSVAMGRS